MNQSELAILTAITLPELTTWYNTGSSRFWRDRLYFVRVDSNSVPVLDRKQIEDVVTSLPVVRDDYELIWAVIQPGEDLELDRTINQRGLVNLDFADVATLLPPTPRAQSILKTRLQGYCLKLLGEPFLSREFALVAWQTLRAQAELGGMAFQTIANYRVDTITQAPKLLDEVVEGLELRASGANSGANLIQNLICYDRHETRFESSSLGYLQDFGRVLRQTFFPDSKDPVPTELESLGRLIVSYRDGQIDIWNRLGEIEACLEDVDSVGNEIPISAALVFLQLRSELMDGASVDSSSIGHITASLVADDRTMEFELGVWLAGAFFGFDRFADAYYESVREERPHGTVSDVEQPNDGIELDSTGGTDSGQTGQIGAAMDCDDAESSSDEVTANLDPRLREALNQLRTGAALLGKEHLLSDAEQALQESFEANRRRNASTLAAHALGSTLSCRSEYDIEEEEKILKQFRVKRATLRGLALEPTTTQLSLQ